MEKLKEKHPVKWDTEANTCFTNDYEFVEKIRKEYRIIAEGIGTPKTSRRQNKILISPFCLNQYDSAYLYEKY
jgi:hypothetical protein